MDIKDSYRPIDGRSIRLQLIDGTFVTGQVNLNRHPGYDRVSDLVTENTEQFLILFSVSVKNRTQDHPQTFKTMMINRAHILWAAPEASEPI